MGIAFDRDPDKTESALEKPDEFDTSRFISKMSVLECVQELTKLNPKRWATNARSARIHYDGEQDRILLDDIDLCKPLVLNHLFAAVCSEIEELSREHPKQKWSWHASWSTAMSQYVFSVLIENKDDATSYFWTEFGKSRAEAALRTLVKFYRDRAA